MNKNVRQYLLGMLAAMLLMLAVPFQSFAANAKIAFSDPNTQVGEEVKVTMKFTSTSGDVLGNTDVMLAYDASLLEFINETENASGGAGAIRVWSGLSGKTEIVTELRFKALQAGTANITVTSWEGYDNNGQLLTMDRQGSSKITIKGLATSSTDATLQSLQVSPGTLQPSFTPGVMEYRVYVGLDAEKLTVSAKANNENAKVGVQGGDALQEGENTVTCTVTAQDGTTTGTYTILVTKSEAGENAGTGESEPNAEAPEVLAELDVTAKKLRIIELPEGVTVPEGFKESSIAIGDTKVTGWTWAADTDPRYCVFYGMNEAGDQDFYRYDLKDKTIQRYFADQQSDGADSDQLQEVINKYNSLVDDYSLAQKLVIGLGAAAAILLLLVIILFATRKRGGGESFREEQRPEPKAASRPARGKKLSREERYMIGEEEDYEEEPDQYEDDDEMAEAYQPEEFEPDEDYHAEVIDARVIYQQAARGDSMEEAPVRPEPERPEVKIEPELARSLSQAAATRQPEPEEDDDDFEIFDLDE